MNWDSLTVILWDENNQEMGWASIEGEQMHIKENNRNTVTLAKSAAGWYFAMPVVHLQPPIIQGIPPMPPPKDIFRFDSYMIWFFTAENLLLISGVVQLSDSLQEEKDSILTKEIGWSKEANLKEMGLNVEDFKKSNSTNMWWWLMTALLTLAGFLFFRNGKKD